MPKIGRFHIHEEHVRTTPRPGWATKGSSWTCPARRCGREGGQEEGASSRHGPGTAQEPNPPSQQKLVSAGGFEAVTGMLPTGDVTRFGRGFRREEMSCAERAGERDKPAASGNSLRRGPQSGRSKARPRDSSNRLGMAGRMERFRSRRIVVRREITMRAGSAASWLLPLPCYEVWQARPFHLA